MAKCHEYQFPGKGQRNAAVMDVHTAIELIMLLPGKRAKQYRKAGVQALLNVMNPSQEFVNEMTSKLDLQTRDQNLLTATEDKIVSLASRPYTDTHLYVRIRLPAEYLKTVKNRKALTLSILKFGITYNLNERHKQYNRDEADNGYMIFSFAVNSRSEAEIIENILKVDFGHITVDGSREYVDTEKLAEILKVEYDATSYESYVILAEYLFRYMVKIITHLWGDRYEAKGYVYGLSEMIPKFVQQKLSKSCEIVDEPLEVELGFVRKVVDLSSAESEYAAGKEQCLKLLKAAKNDQLATQKRLIALQRKLEQLQGRLSNNNISTANNADQDTNVATDNILDSIITMNFENNTLIVASRASTVLFRAKDVADVLGLSNYRRDCSNLGEEDKETIVTASKGGRQPMTYLTEVGVGTLMAKSGIQVPGFKAWLKQVSRDICEQERQDAVNDALEKQRRELDTNRVSGIYAFKRDITKPLDTTWKLGKGINAETRGNDHKIACPNGKVMKVVQCVNHSLAEKILLELMKGLGCHLRSECYDIEDPELLYAAMDLVGHMDRLVDPNQHVELSHLQHLCTQYAGVFEARDRRDIFQGTNDKNPVVRLDPDTRLVLRAYRSVSSASKELPSGNHEDVRKAIENDEVLHGFRYREWRVGDPDFPTAKTSNKAVWKRDPITHAIIEKFDSIADAARNTKTAEGDEVYRHAITKAIESQKEEQGFIWTRHGNAELPPPPEKRKASCVRIKCTDLQGRSTVYESATEASEATGIPNAVISHRTRHNAKRRASDPFGYTRDGKWVFEYADLEAASKRLRKSGTFTDVLASISPASSSSSSSK